MTLFLTIRLSYHRASIAITDTTLKSMISKEMIALTYFKTIFMTNYKDKKCYWNTLITYITNRGILHRHCFTKMNLWDGFEPVLKEYYNFQAVTYIKIASWYLSYCEASWYTYRIRRWLYCFLIELGFNDTSTLEGHFVLSPRESEKRDRIDSTGDEREGQRRKETEWQWRNRRNKNIPPLPIPAARIEGFAQL